MKKSIDISIIITFYNGEKYYKYWCARINEIFRNAKTMCDIECEAIFVNDDPTLNIFKGRKEFLFDCVCIENKRNVGIHASRVKGLKYAKGDFIIFIDQDDLVSDELIISQYKKMLANKSDAVVCNGYLQDKGAYIVRKIYATVDEQEKTLFLGNYLGGSSLIVSPGQVLLRKSSIPKEWINNIVQINGADDLFLWILMMEHGCKFSLNVDYLYTHVFTGENTSTDKKRMKQSISEVFNKLDNYGVKKKEFEMEELFKLLDKPMNKETRLVSLLDKWLYYYQNNISVSDWLNTQGIKHIDIYGMGILGNRLYSDIVLNNTCVVDACIDKNANKMEMISQTQIGTLNEIKKNNLGKTEIVIVTVTNPNAELLQEIAERLQVRVVTLQEIFDLMDEMIDNKTYRVATNLNGE